jgi:hypothetical protein
MWTAALLLSAVLAIPPPIDVAALRAEGQPAVDRLVAEYQRLTKAHRLDAAADARFRAAIDAVCRQFDCSSSGLYWYTDLDAARAEARRSHRPILSLRLLGNLDEEMSCANSRYFRTILYANHDIAAFLRKNFVLHWSSERAAPVVTIDFGDGRVMRRTITGNSIHYLLDEKAVPLDAIPGLYAPKPFLAQLVEMKALFDAWSKASPVDRTTRLSTYHRMRSRSALIAAKRDGKSSEAERRARLQKPSTAWEAAPLAASKQGGEAPLLMNISFGVNAVLQQPAVWLEKLSSSKDFTALDANSVDLIRRKRAAAPIADAGSDADLERLLAKFQDTLRRDTLYNEYELRPRIREVLAGVASFEQLNAFVYSSVFLTPRQDEWLGLLPDATFTGLTAEGLQRASR